MVSVDTIMSSTASKASTNKDSNKKEIFLDEVFYAFYKNYKIYIICKEELDK